MGEIIGTTTLQTLDASGTPTTTLGTIILSSGDLGYLVILQMILIAVLLVDLVRRFFIRK